MSHAWFSELDPVLREFAQVFPTAKRATRLKKEWIDKHQDRALQVASVCERVAKKLSHVAQDILSHLKPIGRKTSDQDDEDDAEDVASSSDKENVDPSMRIGATKKKNKNKSALSELERQEYEIQHVFSAEQVPDQVKRVIEAKRSKFTALQERRGRIKDSESKVRLAELIKSAQAPPLLEMPFIVLHPRTSYAVPFAMVVLEMGPPLCVTTSDKMAQRTPALFQIHHVVFIQQHRMSFLDRPDIPSHEKRMLLQSWCLAERGIVPDNQRFSCESTALKHNFSSHPAGLTLCTSRSFASSNDTIFVGGSIGTGDLGLASTLDCKMKTVDRLTIDAYKRYPDLCVKPMATVTSDWKAKCEELIAAYGLEHDFLRDSQRKPLDRVYCPVTPSPRRKSGQRGKADEQGRGTWFDEEATIPTTYATPSAAMGKRNKQRQEHQDSPVSAPGGGGGSSLSAVKSGDASTSRVGDATVPVSASAFSFPVAPPPVKRSKRSHVQSSDDSHSDDDDVLYASKEPPYKKQRLNEAGLARDSIMLSQPPRRHHQHHHGTPHVLGAHARQRTTPVFDSLPFAALNSTVQFGGPPVGLHVGVAPLPFAGSFLPRTSLSMALPPPPVIDLPLGPLGAWTDGTGGVQVKQEISAP